MRVLLKTRQYYRGVLVILVCCCSVTIFGQQAQKKTANLPAEDSKIAQKQELIGRLVSIANELKSEADKPNAALLQSEVADVLWRFDEPAARSIFRLAFDTVRQDITNNSSSSAAKPGRDSLTQSQQRTSAIRVILQRFGLHDRKGADAWLREFENDVKSGSTNSNNNFRISPEQADLLADIAAGMVFQDAKEAQRLGSLSLSAARMPSGFTRLLMGLRDKDKALSDILLRQALLSMRSNGFAYDPVLISISNYVFFSNATPLPDVSSADIALTIQYFVDAAGAQAAQSRSGTVRASNDPTALSLYSFLRNRVLPIVARNAPDKSVLFQSSLASFAEALTLEQRRQAEILASLGQPNSVRSSGDDSDIESLLRRAEQEKDVAARDLLFRSLVMQLIQDEPERALDVARKIADQQLRAQTEDDVYLVLMQKAFVFGSETEAMTLALKFNDLPRRARWLAQIAGSKMRRSKDRIETLELLSQAHAIAAKGDDTPVKLEVLLFIAKEFVRFDQDRGFEILSEALSLTNRLEKAPSQSKKSTISPLRLIRITVIDGEEVSTDDRVTIDSIDFNQVSAFVERDYLRTSYLGSDIKDRFFRSKYFIALARSVLQVPRQGAGYERTLESLLSN